jgi:integrase
MKKVRGADYLYARNGVFYFRRGVPADALAAFGKTEVIKSLGTRELSVARHLVADELRGFESILAENRGLVSPIEQATRSMFVPSWADIEAAVRKWLLERDERLHGHSLAVGEWDAEEEEVRIRDERAALDHFTKNPRNELDAQWIAEHLLEEYGWEVAPTSKLFHRMRQLIIRGKIESNERRRQEATGEPVKNLDQRFSPESYALDKDRKVQKASVSLKGLLESSLNDPKPAAKTEKAYRHQFKQFCDFLGHDNALDVTVDDAIRWKETLQKRITNRGTLLKAKTINAKYFSVLNRVFSWAVDNRILEKNPAEGIKMRSVRQPKLRDRDFTDAEAEIILRGTLEKHSPRLTPQRRFARRWLPWLCAYTGARVGEIAQLRREDVSIVEGFWVIRITPEAGSVKNHEARVVALHPHLIEQGFPDQLKGKSGPLFFDPSLAKGGSAANKQSDKVGQHIAGWVRQLGVTDTSIMPNHAWRHRFATLARRYGIPEEHREQIVGRAPNSEGRKYGSLPIDVIAAEISKLPRYECG